MAWLKVSASAEDPEAAPEEEQPIPAQSEGGHEDKERAHEAQETREEQREETGFKNGPTVANMQTHESCPRIVGKE